MNRLPMLRRFATAAAFVALLPLSVEARIDTPPGMQTDATNASNPAALQNLSGGSMTYSGSQLQMLGTSDADWQTLFPTAKFVVTQHGQNNAPILGYFYNDLASGTNGTPSAITGYGRLDPSKTGNHVFGLYGR